ncbi:MAG: nucleotide sugar dehydrogenase, partial [Ruthenibacterium sp.]
ETIRDMDAVILAVAHTRFSTLSLGNMDALFGNGQKVLLDLKGLLNRKEYEAAGYAYWRL